MLRGLTFRRSAASIVGSAMLCSTLSPVAYGLGVRRQRTQIGAVVELYSNKGVLKKRIEGPPRALQDSNSPVVPSSGLTPEQIARLRSELEQYAARTHGKRSMSLALQVLDAFAAPSDRERHRLIGLLPVTHDAQVYDDGAGHRGTIVTFYLNGIVKSRVIEVAPTGSDQGASEPLGGGPYVSDEISPSNTSGKQLAVTGGYCPDNPDDCATQEDRDDYWASYVALDSDVESMQADEQDNNDACVAANQCYVESDSPAERLVESAGVVDETRQALEASPIPAIGQFGPNVPGCYWEYADAAGAYLAYAAVGAALAIAIFSPDPVSKFALAGLWAGVLGGSEVAAHTTATAMACYAKT